MFEPVTSIIVKCLDFWRFNEKIHKKMDKTWLYLSAMVRPNGNCFFYNEANFLWKIGPKFEATF